jgi:hypothetical protein
MMQSVPIINLRFSSACETSCFSDSASDSKTQLPELEVQQYTIVEPLGKGGQQLFRTAGDFLAYRENRERRRLSELERKGGGQFGKKIERGR